jgi:SAM-dependent methyltransferase
MAASVADTDEASASRKSVTGVLAELPSGDVDVLEFGCGRGARTLSLAPHVRSAIGVDPERTSIAHARRTLSAAPRENCAFLLMKKGCIPLPDASVDAVFSIDAFPRIVDVSLAFGEIARVLRPGGVLVTRFSPLFYSPYGYDMRFACHVPYAHLLFGLDSILALRRERTGHLLEVTTWQGTGLNCHRFMEFKRAVLGAKLELVRFDPVPVPRLAALTRVPVLRDFFTVGIDCLARRPVVDAAHPPPTSSGQLEPTEKATSA